MPMTGTPQGETYESHTHDWHDTAGSPESLVDRVVYTKQNCSAVGTYYQNQDGNEAGEQAFGHRRK